MLSQHGSVIGTAEYISPEQARGGTAGPASDLYSLGVVLFEMLTGRLPFTGELALAVAGQHARTPAPPVREVNPAVPAALAHVVDRALSKDPALRHGSAGEMKAALTAPPMEAAPTLVAPTVRIPAPAPTRVIPPPPGRRGLTRRHGLAALAVVAALGGAAFVLTAGDGGGKPLVGLPRVVGMPVATAKAALVARGFDARIGAQQHADRPPGTVVGIRPAGASAALGAVITIIPSSGPREAVIPAIAGLSQAAATAELERRGFVVHSGIAYSPSVPAGTAVATAPPEGTAIPPRSSIELTVSAGAAPVAPAKPGNGPKDKHKNKKRGKFAANEGAGD